MAKKTTEQKKKSVKYLNVKDSLKTALNAIGASNPLFDDLIEDYMALWLMKNLLIEDIELNGVKCEIDPDKANPSVDKLRQTNSQMLKILSELGISATKMAAISNNDEL